MNASAAAPRFRADAGRRLIVWLAIGIWAVSAYTIAGKVADKLRIRINDLSVIPGAGLIMRDPEGVFFHVNTEGRARAVYPDLAPPTYKTECIDCTLVTGEQLSQTNDFCIAGYEHSLPQLEFETPCHTWTPMGQGRKVVGFTLFIAPLLLIVIGRFLLNRAAEKSKLAGAPKKRT